MTRKYLLKLSVLETNLYLSSSSISATLTSDRFRLDRGGRQMKFRK